MSGPPAAQWILQYPLGLYQTCARDEKETDRWLAIDGPRANPPRPAGIGFGAWHMKPTPLFSFAEYPVACYGDEGEGNPP